MKVKWFYIIKNELLYPEICNLRFLKEEPERLESALRRCKKLTGTLVTLKRYVNISPSFNSVILSFHFVLLT